MRHSWQPSGVLKSLISAFKRIGSDRAGNVAMIFALAAIPLLGTVGAGIDYSIAYRARSKLQAVADNAALLAVSKSEVPLSASTAQTDAQNFFAVQATALGLSASTLTVNVTDNTSGRTAVISFTGATATNILGVMGFSTIPFSGSSTAAVALPVYIDFYLLLDNTPSMGVAATPTDVTNLQALTVSTPDGTCAFACHNIYQPGNHSQLDTNTNYDIAKANSVTTRIDVVRQATQSLMDTATNVAVVSNQFRMAIYTPGSGCDSLGLTTITALTSSLSTAKTAANNIDLMTIPYQNYNSDQCTDFDGVFAAMNTTIPTPGAGAGTSTAPQKFLFFVSDGVADANYPGTCTKPTTGGRCQEPLTVATCTAMKARGVQIAVLYTTYLALPSNGWYMNWIDPFNQGPFGPSPNSQIAQNMQTCASPGYYFEVSPTQGISDAMNALFKKAVAQARLTQ